MPFFVNPNEVTVNNSDLVDNSNITNIIYSNVKNRSGDGESLSVG